MIPGEYRTATGTLLINAGRSYVSILVCNQGDRPVQVGSHFHFYEVNRALSFERSAAFGMRLDIPSGTAVRFEPGEEKHITLVSLGGTKEVFGLNNLTGGSAQPELAQSEDIQARLKKWLGGETLG
ncbi:hypothetical protein SY83_07985 [Paenibacillus swuensis]|uniref:Urease subunit beta n=1 Tax=Paenibacillus swuensis TaxID=1178515 RepID=A0A172TGT7_9BACL|nr:urease subunit beta [Paenibacillus swuensis]ANE46220.1 hypothetical protein SY83_07985 [Paenibacillus swuensis]